MRGNEFLDKLEWIDPTYIEAADRTPEHKYAGIKKWCAISACLCLVLSLSIPAMAAQSSAFYQMLYAISPVTAQFFKPIQLSCEGNGIRMEVVAVYVHEDTAEIYISLQDLTKTRFGETVDLFDSYHINAPFDYTGHCSLASYDSDTQTATFLITIQQWNNQCIIGDKLTFSIQELLSNKKTYQGLMDGVDLSLVELTTATQTVQPRGYSGNNPLYEHTGNDTNDCLYALKPAASITSPVDGVTLTGVGYVDGQLHVQIYYEDILHTDNHGSVTLKNSKTGNTIHCNAAISFFDNARKGSYEDYIFEIPEGTLGDYKLYGDFVVSSGLIEGNWSVTFPLESLEDQ